MSAKWSLSSDLAFSKRIEFRENVRERPAQNGHFLTKWRENTKGRPSRDGLSIVSH